MGRCAQFKLVERLQDLSASLDQRGHQHQRHEQTKVAGGGGDAAVAGMGQDHPNIDHFPAIDALL